MILLGTILVVQSLPGDPPTNVGTFDECKHGLKKVTVLLHDRSNERRFP